ncbi:MULTISPECIES: hypothetical protein [unclassified Bradyrhizobium]|uniref:hypothetical protein n=1 Tax=unclassified Bradyrhizobium TaxID=2631580 RepID=UPI00247A5B01|nr:MULTISPECIES: hypothetical protein [unclassified Bradyrhizobium]WGS18259.1 hypothetical protein MTX22_27250 [Bradyrhizobium sp. ISRA463]WGS25077.1 hypothetical protein MTX19_24875 [Bradyrhizobium sp. ISRA464]
MQNATRQESASSRDLMPNDDGPLDNNSNEVQFALVIARMIDTVEHSPEHLRQAVYDLARYKLREQFTSADEKDITQTQQALEAAIRGVEEFSRQQIALAAPQVPRLEDGSGAGRGLPVADLDRPAWQRRPAVSIAPAPAARRRSSHPLSPLVMRTIAVLLIVGGAAGVVQQKERLAFWVQHWSHPREQAATTIQQRAPIAAITAAVPAPPPKPNPLRPTDYGVYAVDGDSLTELQLLPGRPPDIRVAVSAALRTPSHTMLSNGHPKFIVFRRDAATNIADRAEVRVIAKVAREFSAEVAGKRPEDGDSWVMRNIAFPFRVSPLPDNPEMYELHSEDPALQLTPGRYALVVKNQAYDFTVDGEVIDPKQCIERIIATNGTFYSDCKKP